MDPDAPAPLTLAPPAVSPFVFSFSLEEADLLAYAAASAEIDPEYRRALEKLRRQRKSILIAAIFVSITFVFGLSKNVLGLANPSSPAGAIMLAVFTAGAWLLWFQYHRALSSRAFDLRARQYVLSDAARSALGEYRMTIGPDGITSNEKDRDVVQRWPGISDVRESADLILLWRRNRHSFVIPKRIFASPAESQAIVHQSREWLDAAGAGDARRLRAFLAERDAPCPRCRYNLRGVTQGKCPECGLMLDLTMLGAAR